jgi:hypothetical protein
MLVASEVQIEVTALSCLPMRMVQSFRYSKLISVCEEYNVFIARRQADGRAKQMGPVG